MIFKDNKNAGNKKTPGKESVSGGFLSPVPAGAPKQQSLAGS
jgi:hypothetical protein